MPEEIREELRGLRRELDELQDLRDRHLRLAAEFDNFRKRTRRQRVEERERAQADLARDLLEVLDDLERVAEAPAETTTVDALHEGVEMVARKLRKTLEDAGLEPIDADGAPFDPNEHEALTTVPTEDPGEDERVARVVTRGYRFGDRLLRPARVAVYQYAGDADAAAGTGSGAGEETPADD